MKAFWTAFYPFLLMIVGALIGFYSDPRVGHGLIVIGLIVFFCQVTGDWT